MKPTGFVAHPLEAFRKLYSSSSRNAVPELEPAFKLDTVNEASLGARVSFLRMADDESKVVAGLANGKIAVWPTDSLQVGKVNHALVFRRDALEDADRIDYSKRSSSRRHPVPGCSRCCPIHPTGPSFAWLCMPPREPTVAQHSFSTSGVGTLLLLSQLRVR